MSCKAQLRREEAERNPEHSARSSRIQKGTQHWGEDTVRVLSMRNQWQGAAGRELSKSQTGHLEANHPFPEEGDFFTTATSAAKRGSPKAAPPLRLTAQGLSPRWCSLL